ncbi:MAG: 50S ribosomal protein L32 [Chloroflexota bacterium]
MPLPKKKVSSARQGNRRAHTFLKPKARSICPCPRKASVLPHRVCPECGHYRGRTAPGSWPQEDLLVNVRSGGQARQTGGRDAEEDS